MAWHNSVNNTINIQLNNGIVQTASYSGGVTDTTAALSIGAYADKTWEFNGKIDEVALYKRTLTAPERS